MMADKDKKGTQEQQAAPAQGMATSEQVSEQASQQGPVPQAGPTQVNPQTTPKTPWYKSKVVKVIVGGLALAGAAAVGALGEAGIEKKKKKKKDQMLAPWETPESDSE